MADKGDSAGMSESPEMPALGVEAENCSHERHAQFAVRRWPEALRWGACFALALSFHAAGAAALLARWNEEPDLVANAPLIMIQLAALPVAPDVKQTEVPPGPQQTQAQPEPEPVKPARRRSSCRPSRRPKRN